jgi:hypothetical protein
MYIAPTIAIAERIRERLADEGYEVRLRAIHVVKSQQHEILVRESEVHEVQELLMSILNEQ